MRPGTPHSFLYTAFIAIAFCGICTPARADTVVLNENFNELSVGLGMSSVGAFSTINGTNIDIIGPGLFGSLCAAPEGGNCIDMNGTGGNPQGQLQSNMLFPAGTYLLSFDLIGSGRGLAASVTVTFGSYDQTFNLTSSDVTGGIVTDATVTLASPGHLLFASDTAGDVGLLLDNVVIATPGTSAVPEPATLALLGTGILGFVAVARRRLLRL